MGAQGVLAELVPAEGAWLLPGVEGDGVEGDGVEFDGFVVEPVDVPFAAFGKVPQGEPAGCLPVFGVAVDGCPLGFDVEFFGVVVLGAPLGEVDAGV
jgi:hypothetical protein